MINETINFACIAHDGQYRKDGITPYISHCARGCVWVIDYIKYERIVAECAIWLHDVPEDCTQADGTIRNHNITFKAFTDTLERGDTIYEIVKLLTHNMAIPKRNRKEDSYRRIMTNAMACQLKFCDRLDNLSGIARLSPGGQEYYIKDTEHMIRVFGDVVKDVNIDLYDRMLLNLEGARNAV
jgi:(p)ppGpp synthase/HD superfamily hydrolase